MGLFYLKFWDLPNLRQMKGEKKPPELGGRKVV